MLQGFCVCCPCLITSTSTSCCGGGGGGGGDGDGDGDVGGMIQNQHVCIETTITTNSAPESSETVEINP